MIDVRAAGVSFPEVLQTRGLYQLKPELPFVPGSEVAGVVQARTASTRFGQATGWRRSACSAGSPRSRSRPPHFTFPLPDALDFAQGAGLILNYHTAYFAL